jgi:hypothetical protein
MSPERRTRNPEREHAQDIRWAELLEEALTMPGSMGKTYNRFYNYSFTNQLLLFMQGVREPVATYKRWQDMGRQVLKGSKAKSILRPVAYKETNDKGEEESKVKGFKMVNCLFTASETEGKELPPYEIPDWNPELALKNLNIEEVPWDGLDGNSQGYSFGRKFALNPVAAYPLKTMMHEIAHIELGHTAPGLAQKEYQQHRGLKEFQAETTAYLLMNELEMTEHMDMAESRSYVQHWLHGLERPDDASIKQVLTATDKILKAGRFEPSKETNDEVRN